MNQLSETSGAVTGGARSRRLRWVIVALGGFAGFGALWLAGLIWFAAGIPRAPAEPTTATDAIVVLTGGAGRLGVGFELLREGRAKKLFISGVYRGVDVAEILRVSQQEPEALACCIAIGHNAVDTIGNARETARWMADEGFASLRLVTADYHMPRSLAEFRRAMPGVTLIAHPVSSENIHVDAWWRWPGTASLIASEYTKHLVGTVIGAPGGGQ